MNRKTSTLISLGISVVLIAVGIWFLYNYHNNFGYGTRHWVMPHHMMRGGGMGMIMLLFWMVVLSAAALLISGLITGAPLFGRHRRYPIARCVGNTEAAICKR